MSGILDGIIVLDFSEYIAGPYCGGLLGDLGAEVIKIEPPDGSEERRWGPSKIYKGNTRSSLTMNRNKKSLCLDIRKKAAKKIIYRLVEKADVVLQNYTPGVAKKLGIDYDTLSTINKKLIFISSTAFGEIGPYKNRRGLDLIAHAASGIMAYYADEDGNPKGPGGIAYIDICTAILNTLSAVAALFTRIKTGEGQKIETSLFTTALALQLTSVVNIEKLDKERYKEELDLLSNAFQEEKSHTEIIDALVYLKRRYDRPDSTRIIDVPDCNHRPADRYFFPYYRIYETANGFISIAAVTSRQRKIVNKVIDIYDKGAGVDFSEITDEIINHQKDLTHQIERRFREKTNQEWIEALESAGVPCGQVNYSVDLFYDPQVKAMNMMCNLENSEHGAYKMISTPIRFSKTPVKPRKGAPTLGEDSVSVLEQFGYSENEIEEFKKQAIIK